MFLVDLCHILFYFFIDLLLWTYCYCCSLFYCVCERCFIHTSSFYRLMLLLPVTLKVASYQNHRKFFQNKLHFIFVYIFPQVTKQHRGVVLRSSGIIQIYTWKILNRTKQINDVIQVVWQNDANFHLKVRLCDHRVLSCN